MSYLLSLLTQKPQLGFALSMSGGAAGLLTWLQLLTPLVGFIGAILGATAGFITLLIKWREWRQGNKKP